jgi:hypothetical protein
MADQNDVRRIALSLPDTSEDDDHFAFSVRNGGKQKGIAGVWMERVEPRKPRVAQPKVIAIRVANQSEKEMLLVRRVALPSAEGPRQDVRRMIACRSR